MSRDNMKLNKITVPSSVGIYGIRVPLKKKKYNGQVADFTMTVEKDRNMNQREYGQACAYVRRALKAYAEQGGE